MWGHLMGAWLGAGRCPLVGRQTCWVPLLLRQLGTVVGAVDGAPGSWWRGWHGPAAYGPDTSCVQHTVQSRRGEAKASADDGARGRQQVRALAVPHHSVA